MKGNFPKHFLDAVKKIFVEGSVVLEIADDMKKRESKRVSVVREKKQNIFKK